MRDTAFECRRRRLLHQAHARRRWRQQINDLWFEQLSHSFHNAFEYSAMPTLNFLRRHVMGNQNLIMCAEAHYLPNVDSYFTTRATTTKKMKEEKYFCDKNRRGECGEKTPTHTHTHTIQRTRASERESRGRSGGSESKRKHIFNDFRFVTAAHTRTCFDCDFRFRFGFSFCSFSVRIEFSRAESFQPFAIDFSNDV